MNGIYYWPWETKSFGLVGSRRPFIPDLNMLGISNLYLCVLSILFTINGGLVGEIPFEELHFNQNVLCILDIIDSREFKVSQRRGLAKHRFEN